MRGARTRATRRRLTARPLSLSRLHAFLPPHSAGVYYRVFREEVRPGVYHSFIEQQEFAD